MQVRIRHEHHRTAKARPAKSLARNNRRRHGPVPVHADLKGLLGGTTYHFRLVAVTVSQRRLFPAAGADEEFKTATVPVVANGEAREVTGSGAELTATVNPEGLPVSHCAFEYGTSTAYGRSVRCGQSLEQIGYGTEPVPVSAQVAGLAPSTAYYWRLSVRDENGEAYEPGHAFNALTGGEGLPDNRSYELVTPPFKNGALLGDVVLRRSVRSLRRRRPGQRAPGPVAGDRAVDPVSPRLAVLRRRPWRQRRAVRVYALSCCRAVRTGRPAVLDDDRARAARDGVQGKLPVGVERGRGHRAVQLADRERRRRRMVRPFLRRSFSAIGPVPRRA